ncbi:MAG TPA: response regulator [Verrucomicrobiae bacterium]|jgi:CheY-like chemotaxis protein|nr:response regulator [Verrucomicrobiae bacterium]
MRKVNVKKDFGAAVRAHRLRLGLSQETLAERAQLHRTYVTDVERGARNISLDSISRLAHALDLSISALFGSTTPTYFGSAQDVDILLVEDDPADVELTLAAFREARLSNRVEVVGDGEAAVDFLLMQLANGREKKAQTPLVVLLDLHLPKLHGLEVLTRLRAAEIIQQLHVIVLTNSQQDGDVRRALQLGAKAYLVKPLDFHAFSSITPQLNFSWMLLDPVSASTPGRKQRRTRLKI